MRSTISINSKFPATGTTIFTVMSAHAAQAGALNMAQGFPDFQCPPGLVKLVNHYMKEGKNQYAPMPGVPELRRMISAKTSSLYSAEYDPDSEVTVVGGATLALFCAICAIVRENDEVIVIEPAYDSYIPAIELNGGKAVFAKLKFPGFQVDWGEVKKLINFKTRAIIINSPHNPTGMAFSAQDMQQLEKLVEDTDILIISDEVYEHILFDGLEHQSVARYPKLAMRSFVVSSFGKTYHNTGWKMGYVLAPEKLTAEFRKIYQYAAFSANTPIQYALADFLEDTKHYLSLPDFYQEKRDLFRNLVKHSKFKILPCQGTYFQLLGYDKISSKSDLNLAVELTHNSGIASIPISTFYHDKTDNKVLRFCFAKSGETLKKAAEILCSI
ncbi:MAG: aminotransferase class I/II-fold pyridoxal phosphate-dependent enzyme [Bacteroidetes bacterium]|nr:aminotransferase class I/II-fold pyridoxal phosphate-dependent enzyme [Bacteroidota bacterium]